MEAGECVLRYLSGHDMERARALGFSGYTAFDLTQIEHRKGVLAAFLRRLPPRSRADFGAYKGQFRLKSDLVLSDFALLAYTEAKLPSDGFSIVNPLDGVCAPCQFLLEVAGYRHYAGKLAKPLSVGQPLHLTAEPSNKYDPNAVRVETGSELVGYVNRLQAPAFLRWMKDHSIGAFVDRLNGSVAKPRLLMFVDVAGDRATRVA
ncbi:HIRAN domain-containing protein [Bradyrhizobium sp. 174]|uniref:HIRAN domain-containing protein n=1 Tax=Bradyrhizobium sp. 174 TaxID=2782645 RepID=UPI001FFB39D3|nr:HIRAN domain-containing protein [Bradyrhizobium sp. 174]MCK1573912.1 HIRAN domain-containing protein [Bradyrhizobium sp. 174]